MNMKLEQSKDNLVSIIIATYNAASQLPGCLASIKAQSFSNLEIVVIDGGSTDSTIALLQAYDKPNLVWVSEKDKGIYDALNKGIKKATGNWLYFMGADDRLLPGFSELASRLTGRKTVHYGYSKEFYDPRHKPSFVILTGEFTPYRLAKYCLNHQAIIYPRRAFYTAQYNLKYKVLADYAFNLKIWGDRSFKKIYYPIAIASYNMDGFSSQTEDVAFKKDKAKLIRKYMGYMMYLRFLLKKYKKRRLGETDFE